MNNLAGASSALGVGNNNGYDASVELSSNNGSFFFNDNSGTSGCTRTTATTGASNTSNSLLSSMNASTSSLSVSATPVTKAKHLYGKIKKREQDEIRAQSALLFQSVAGVTGGGAAPF